MGMSAGGKKSGRGIFVRGDKDADYGQVMKVMARISSAGFKNMGLVSLPEAGG